MYVFAHICPCVCTHVFAWVFACAFVRYPRSSDTPGRRPRIRIGRDRAAPPSSFPKRAECVADVLLEEAAQLPLAEPRKLRRPRHRQGPRGGARRHSGGGGRRQAGGPPPHGAAVAAARRILEQVNNLSSNGCGVASLLGDSVPTDGRRPSDGRATAERRATGARAAHERRPNASL